MNELETRLPGFIIVTRQKSDLLFGLLAGGLPIEEIGAGEVVPFGVMKVAGYGRVSFFAASPQPFTILVEEGCSPEGIFSQAAVLTSALDAVTGLQFVAAHVFPSGTYMQATLTSTGAAADIQFCGRGLPHSSGGP